MNSRIKDQYHWIIVASVFILYAAGMGGGNMFSIIAPSVMEEMHLSAGAVQTVTMAATAARMVSSVTLSILFVRFGMKKVLTFCAVITVIGIMGRSMVSGLPALILCALVYGFGTSGVTSIPGGMLINNWFDDRKGFAGALAFSGSVVGALVYSQIGKHVIEARGWRTFDRMSAVSIGVMMLPVTIWIVRERPREMGLLPYRKGTDRAGREKPQRLPAGRDITPAQFFRSGVFRMLALSVFLMSFGNNAVQNNLTVCMQLEHGAPPSLATDVFSIAMFTQIFGKLVLGWMYDRKGIRFASVYNMILTVISAALFFAADTPAGALACGAMWGIVLSMNTITPPYITSYAAGGRYYGQIYGIITLVQSIGGAVGPIAAGMVFDRTGSFGPVWVLIAALAVPAMACFSCVEARGQESRGQAR